MQCHASQISPDDFFLAMPVEGFALAFGTEWFIAEGATRPADAPFGDDLFAAVVPSSAEPDARRRSRLG